MNIPNRTHGLRFLLLQAAAIGLLAASSAHADDGTWNVDANGNWSTTTNWLDDIIADGSGFTANFTNDITADRTVTLDGPRTITNVVFGDSDTATAGNWLISGTNSLTLAGSTPTITVNALGTGKTATISAPVIGADGLTKAGVGTLVINKGAGGLAASFPSGPLTVNGGTLQVNNTASSSTTNILTLASLTTIDNGSTLSFTRTGAEGRVIPSGGITFGASGGNTLSSDFTGNVFLIQGNWTFTAQGGATNFITSTADGVISMQNASSNRILEFNVADGTDASDLEVNMTVLLGGIKKSGAGVLTMTQPNTTINALEIAAGTLELAGVGRLNSTATNNGIFATNITNNGTLLYNGTDAQTLSGVMSGSGSLTKSGNSTLTLSGSNTYGGATTVSAGALKLNVAGAVGGSSGVSIASGASLDVSAIAGGLTVASGQSLGGAGSILGDLVFGSGSKLVFSTTDTLAMSGGTASFFAGTAGSRFGIDDLVGISSSTPTGTYTLISGTVDTTNLDNLGSGNAYNLGAGVSAYFQQGSLQVVVVPEPSAVALVGIGFAGIAWAVTRRRRNGDA